MPKKKRSRSGSDSPLCVYCDARPGITKDHVIARSFFETVPETVITVPCCRPCNARKQEAEQYFRDFLTVDAATHKHPDAQAIYHGPMQRALAKNRSVLARDARATLFAKPVITPAGLYLGNFPAIVLRDEMIETLLTLMVRGFLFKQTNMRIPQDYIFQIGRVDPFRTLDTAKMFLPLRTYDTAYWGDQVCGYMLAHASDNPATTMWLIWFYGGGVMFLINTFRPDALAEYRD